MLTPRVDDRDVDQRGLPEPGEQEDCRSRDSPGDLAERAREIHGQSRPPAHPASATRSWQMRAQTYVVDGAAVQEGVGDDDGLPRV
jgi:hypothetical protein